MAPHCAYNAATSKDSDRDGLEDGEEVFGLPASTADAEVPLARWGASPLRKDVFLQVSYLTELGVPNGVLPVPLGMNPFAWLSANPNLPDGFYKHTVEDWVASVAAPFTPASPNDHVKNPDDSSGVALHIDLGVPSLDPADEAEFGAYSMAASRAIVGDLVVNVTAPVDGYVLVRINGSPWQWFYAAGWTVEQVATVIGQKAEDTGEPVFVQSVHCPGTPCGPATVAIRSAVPGQHFTGQVLLSPDAPGAVTVGARESTESLLARYKENSTIDAARRGRFRLSIATALGTGGQAPVGYPASVVGVGHTHQGAPPTQIAHELGHSLGFDHGGHALWGAHTADCIPQYRSLMSYAPTEYRFADSDDPLTVNPARATEGAPFGGSFPYSIFYDPNPPAHPPWHYMAWAPPWNFIVDMNRNGAFDYGAFRAPALSAFASSCRAYVQGHSTLAELTNVGGPVDLVRAGSRLYALWSQGTSIRYRRATLGAIGNKSCTGSADPTQASPCLTWWVVTTLATGSAYEGVSAHVFGGQLFVAANTATGALWLGRFTVNANGTLSFLGSSSFAASTAHGPDLTEVFVSGQSVLAVLYLDLSGKYRQRLWSGSAWGAPSDMLDQSGTPISGTEGPAALAWPDVDRGWPVSERKTFVVLTDAAKRIAIHERLGSGHWHQRYAPAPLGPITTQGKPFLTFRAIRRADGSTYDTAYHEYPGHFLIGAVTEHQTAFVRFSATYDRFNPPGVGFAVQFVGDHLYNVWARGQGSATSVLYSDSTIDNVFGVLVLGNRLEFLPHADGSPDRDYEISSDFRALEDMVCQTLQAPEWAGAGCGDIDVTD